MHFLSSWGSHFGNTDVSDRRTAAKNIKIGLYMYLILFQVGHPLHRDNCGYCRPILSSTVNRFKGLWAPSSEL